MCSSAGDDHGLASMENLSRSEYYPLKPLVTDDVDLQVPFPALCGENVTHLGKTSDGVIALSDYRLFIRFKDTFVNVALGLIESVEYRDIFFLHIYCKDAHSIRCTFATNDLCITWYKRLCLALERPAKLEKMFAFAYRARTEDLKTDRPDAGYQLCKADENGYSFSKEVERMGFDLKVTKAWRISYINQDYDVCPTYPKEHIVPACSPDDARQEQKPTSDQDGEQREKHGSIRESANFRACRRFPSVVWRDTRSGAVIVRCSQPEIGWLGWRSQPDELLLKDISAACMLNGAPVSNGTANGHAGEIPESEAGRKKMLIIDARSYTSAVANRAKGGGCECPEYYPNCEIQFMSLANIHSIRKSFQAVRNLCAQAADQPGWLTGVDNTKWLQHIMGLLRTALIVVKAIDMEQRPVLVHCSDGWDRTPQIVALSELLLDPYYRTIEGFRVLVEKEWLSFGHKFADRSGHGLCSEDTNERCPVFVQWLDCIHQLLLQFPCAFQFNEAFLVKLAQHTYSCLFGTFLCNFEPEREKNSLALRTCSVWSLLHPNNKKFVNLLYRPAAESVLRPSCQLQHLQLWNAMYMSETAPTAALENLPEISDHTPEEVLLTDQTSDPTHLPKTRSCESLLLATENASDIVGGTLGRRSSDPNIKTDANELLKSMPNLHTTGENDADVVLVNGNAQDDEDSEEAEPVTESKSDADCSTLKEADTQTPACLERTESNGTEVESPSSETLPVCNGNAPDEDIAQKSSVNGLKCDEEDEEVGKKSEICDNSKTGDKATDEPETTEPSDNMDDNDDVSDQDDDSDDDTCPDSSKHLCNGHAQFNVLHTEGSTDTLVEDTSERTSEHKQGDSDSADPDNALPKIMCNGDELESKNRLLMHHPDKLSHISTSTSDISDSHVNGIGRQLPHGFWQDDALMDLTAPGGRNCTYNGRPVVGGGVSVGVSSGSDLQSASSGKASCASVESDTCVSQCSHSTPCSTNPPTPGVDVKTCPWVKRQLSGLGKHLDCDGLITYTDPVQQRMGQMEAEYQCQIQQLKLQLNRTRQMLYQYASGRNGAGRILDHRDETLSNESADSNEYNSLGGGSTAASDLSWEPLEEHDAPLTRWVPDHAVTHCGSCEQKFGLIWRRHHCRNCGNIFCSECAKYYTPLPQLHLLSPERVCHRCFRSLSDTTCVWDTNEGSQETLVAKG